MKADLYEGLVDGPSDRRLLEAVHPPSWVNPLPDGRFNLVVVGGGTAGLVSAIGAAMLGARVALCEREMLGGDCLTFGCVPSKALIRSAEVAAEARHGGPRGVRAGALEVDFAAALERVRRLRADIGPHDSAEKARSVGVQVHFGSARFIARDALEIAGQTLRFARAIIATGARAVIPPIRGLREARPLTHVTVFGLTARPRSVAIIGGGPIGCELAQALARLGTEVTILSDEPRLLPKDDPDAGRVVARALQSDGVRLELGVTLTEVSPAGTGHRVSARRGEQVLDVQAERILVAAGRAADLDDLGLEAAAVRREGAQIEVDDHLRTSNRRIYAAGDVAGRWAFTHAADAMARIALRNALFFGRSRVSMLQMPWCTYTTPEVAHVGITAHEALQRGAAVRTHTTQLVDNDRAIVEERTEGFARAHVDARSGRLLGGTLVAPHAGESIGELTLALRTRQRIGDLAGTIHPYPTYAEAWKRLGDESMRDKLTPGLATALRRLLAWKR